MPAAMELAIAKACNKVLQTSYLLPFICLCAVAAASIQIVLDFTTEHAQAWFTNYMPLNHLGFAAWNLLHSSAYKIVLLLLQSLPLFALWVGAFTVQHLFPDSFGQSTYINWSLVTISNKGDAESIQFSHLWIFSPSRIIASLQGGEPNNKKRNCLEALLPMLQVLN